MRITIYDSVVRQQAWRYSVPERTAIAHEIEAGARARAAIETGKYASSFGVEVAGEDVTVYNDDPAARHIVLGTSDTPPHTEIIDEARKHGTYYGMKPKRG
jgi:hypothetical protein